LEFFPDDVGLRFNLGGMLVKKRNFEEGWKYFESRLDFFPHHKLLFPPDLKPKWDSSQSIEGKTIYVYPASYEFGYGDSIMFVRYLPLLKNMGANVICKTQPGLVKFFRENDLGAEIIDNSVSDDELKFDYQLPYMSMPYAFNVNPDNISAKAYLKADPQKVQYYKEKFFNNDNFKVGIVWKTNVVTFKHAFNLIPHISLFSEIAKIPNVKLYSIQKGEAERELNELPDGMEVINLGQTFNDFADTAAAIENLDLLISIDTSVAHLSGGLGKRTWILLPYAPNWRWHLDSEDSPWYKNARLFRQTKPCSWDDVLVRVEENIKNLINNN
jgi:hypothetical protein